MTFLIAFMIRVLMINKSNICFTGTEGEEETSTTIYKV